MSSVDFSFGDLIDEAVERAGLNPAALTHRHLTSITRSLQLLFIELETKGAHAEYRMETRTWTIAANAGGVVLDADVIDVSQAALIIDDKPIPLGRSTRDDFLTIAFPTTASTPTIFFLTKSIRTSGNTERLPTGVTIPTANVDTPVLVLWPQNGLTGTTYLRATIMRHHAMPTTLGEELDTRRSWLPTLCAGLSMHVARKYNPEMWQPLEIDYKAALLQRDADEDFHPVTIGYRGHGWPRARRH